MLKARLITALTLLPLVLLAFLFGPAWFVIAFLLICLTLSVFEMAVMLIPAFERKLSFGPESLPEELQAKPLNAQGYIFPGVAVLLGWAILLFSVNGTTDVAVGGIALAAMIALLIGSFSSSSIDIAVARAFGILIAVCYGALPWLLVWQLYKMGANARYVLLVMTVTWMGDTGGYFGGRYLGGKLFGTRKLAPVISPNKTWEGAVSGLILSVLGALILNLCFAFDLGSSAFIAKLAALAGIFAQLGDLVESTFKRFSGVKNSGAIMPGHGGFLDRVDGILFAVPVIWAILYYFG